MRICVLVGPLGNAKDASAAEDEMLRGDDAYKGGRPVSDEGDKVLQAEEEVLRDGAHGDGNHDSRDDDGEDVPWDLDEPGYQGLEVERDGIHGARRVAQQREGEHCDDELAKTTSGGEHGRKDAAHQGLVVRLLPPGHVGYRARNGRAEGHEQNGWDDQACVRVGEDARRGDLRVKVRRQITGDSGPGDHVARDDHAVANDSRGGRGGEGSLLGQIGATASRRDGDGDDGGDKGVCLIVVQDSESAEGDEQAQQGDDNDARVGRHIAVRNGGETLPANNADDDDEARQGGEVEQDGDRYEIPAEAVPGLDHLAKTCLGPKGCEICGCAGG